MTKYEIIAESLQEKVNSGELTLEDARLLNDVAYENYADDDTEYEMEESYEDEGVTYEEYLEAMEYELFGEATRLAKEIHKKRIEADDEYNRILNDPEEDNPIRRLHNSREYDNLKREKLVKIDSLGYGNEARKLKKKRDILSSYESDRKIRKGKSVKKDQQRIYDTKPSKKSLENKEPGKYISKLK